MGNHLEGQLRTAFPAARILLEYENKTSLFPWRRGRNLYTMERNKIWQHIIKNPLTRSFALFLFLLFLNITSFFFFFFPEVIMSDSINIQVNKWKNNRWAWSRSTGTATGNRACLSLWQLNIALPRPAFPPSPYRHGQWLAAAVGHSCFKCSEKSKTGQWKAGSCGITALGLPSRAQPGFPLMVRRGRRWQQRWHYQTICKNQTSPRPDGSRGHFGPFLVTLEAPWVCAILPSQPPWISAVSPYFAIHISSPTAVPPFPWGGGTIAAATAASKQCFCPPSAPFWMRPQPACRLPSQRLEKPMLLKPGSQSILVLTGCKTAAVHHTMHTMRNVY